MKNIYVFGSVVRGEIDKYSDVDLLLITDEKVKDVNTEKYSIYTPERIAEMYKLGNPFAWHLYYESKSIFLDDQDFLKALGAPSEYKDCLTDMIKFHKLFSNCIKSIKRDNFSLIFDLAMIFLSLRNCATCFSLGTTTTPIFSRLSFEKFCNYPLVLAPQIKNMLMMSRISSTRGSLYKIDKEDLSFFMSNSGKINEWFNLLIKNYESRI